MFFSSLFEQCPNTGKIRGMNKSAWPKWALLFAGLAACVWYLFRVIRKAVPRGVSLPARGRAPADRLSGVLCRFWGICIFIGKGQVAFKDQTAFPGRPLFCGVHFSRERCARIFCGVRHAQGDFPRPRRMGV